MVGVFSERSGSRGFGLTLAGGRDRASRNDAVPACPFRFVESLISAREQAIDAICSFVESGYANRDGNLESDSLVFKAALFEASTDLFSSSQRLLQTALGENDSEFFPAIATGNIVRPDAAEEKLACQLQREVAGGVSKVIVERFEIIEIECKHRHGPFVSASSNRFAIEEFLHVSPVVEPGERVTYGLKPKGFTHAKI